MSLSTCLVKNSGKKVQYHGKNHELSTAKVNLLFLREGVRGIKGPFCELLLVSVNTFLIHTAQYKYTRSTISTGVDETTKNQCYG